MAEEVPPWGGPGSGPGDRRGPPLGGGRVPTVGVVEVLPWGGPGSYPGGSGGLPLGGAWWALRGGVQWESPQEGGGNVSLFGGGVLGVPPLGGGNGVPPWGAVLP